MTAPVSTDIIIRIHQWFSFIVKANEVSEIVDCILLVSFKINLNKYVYSFVKMQRTFKITEIFERNISIYF